MTKIADIKPGRLSAEALAENFGDAHPPLDRRNALAEASRCYYCYDAPCIQACPTGIDIPSFIRKIAADNVKGAADDILSANIMGGMCARVCPTEILCEEKCVRNDEGHKPVTIGALQRYATDWLFDKDIQLFQRQPATGNRVAVIGGGPAGLSCAHRLSMLGHDVVVFEAREKAGGLNEYGIAAYKTPHDFAQREVAYITDLGGIEIRMNQALGKDISLAQLRGEYDAVFLGAGLGGVNALRAEGEELPGVANAVEYIAQLRQTKDLSKLPIGRKVLVIGGGNTAIDVATQAKRLGAEDVTLVYRRGQQGMSATWVEQDWAQTNGVRVKHWLAPRRIMAEDGAASGVEFEYTQLDATGKLTGTGETCVIEADMIFKAIGQTFLSSPLQDGGADLLEIKDGRIAVNADMQTSLPDVWAGGDCALAGQDLTVQAVEHGKIAAHSIDRALRGKASA